MGLGSLWGLTPPRHSPQLYFSILFGISRRGAVEALEMALAFPLCLRVWRERGRRRRPERRRQNEAACTFVAAPVSVSCKQVRASLIMRLDSVRVVN